MPPTEEELKAQADAKAKAEAEAKAKAEAEAKAKAEEDKPPTYEPKDPNKVKAQAEFYAKNPNDLYALLTEIEKKTGVKMIQEDDGKPDAEERIARMEAETAKFKAAVKYKLSEDDVAILDGTPAEIESKARYLAERLAHAAKQAGLGNGEGQKPPEGGGPPIPKVMTFPPGTDIKAAQGKALDEVARLIQSGEGPKV